MFTSHLLSISDLDIKKVKLNKSRRVILIVTGMVSNGVTNITM